MTDTSTFRDPQSGGSLILAWQAKQKTILIVGGGAVAAGRVFSALEADAQVTVVAPALCPELQHRAAQNQITWHERKFQDHDLDSASMVLTAISDRDESRRIANLCRERKTPVNAADINDLCDFWFMSTHRDHSVQIAVSTNSKAPRLANRIRRVVAAALPRGTGLAVDKIGRLRQRIREIDPSPANGKRRMNWLTQLCDYWPIEQLARMDSDNIDDLLHAYAQQDDPKSVRIAECSAPASPTLGQKPETTRGSLVLVGAGVGDPELLTVRAHRELRHADIVLADKLIPEQVLNLVKCEVYTARKFPGAASEAQDDLNRRGLEELSRGRRVVRLKQGDPFVYGRGAEEILFYRSHGYEAEIVPGLSSAINGPGLCGIPVTHRGVADQVLVVSGANRNGDLPTVPPFVETRTLVILMAVKRLSDIVGLLHAAEYPDTLPVAIVERAGCADQRTVRANLASIVDTVERVGHNAPGLIVVGHAVNVLSDASIQDRFLDLSTQGLHSAE
ncbi:uroporphyrin-III C-methyltransferase [Coemansia sp. RSA 1722]|nr:uroporphyrin-III C-methyltransferase [Coemansia sp. RSA 486]KAJ2226477.1 uroporphyrin-III C-methyltransferase [Coemansia sp. RSA 485]KAJ2596329.1 uroporphyrin-III C-methyltransferase [Coemansia sp. RSA 1721]KAJ2606762.1 uroporphyrin-III C-methyltransferase [Coemansia sp. RSA 1722]KAJ2638869.1 uroporphyrin-III C-methyltransferase [Coemansia sp. RSA 1286]